MSRIVSLVMSSESTIAAVVASTLPITSATDRPRSSPVSASSRSGTGAATFSIRDDAEASIRTSSASSGARVSPTRRSNAAIAVRTSSDTSAVSEGISMISSAMGGTMAEE